MIYYTKDTPLPPYIPVPRFLLKTELSLNAKLLYGLLLSRTQLSAKADNIGKWSDESGAVFIIYPLTQMAAHLGRGLSTIKKTLNELEGAGLLERHRQGQGKANLLYVLVPGESRFSAEFLPSGLFSGPDPDEDGPLDGRCSGSPNGRELAGSKNDKKTNDSSENKGVIPPGTFILGEFQNVRLTQEQLDALQQTYPRDAQGYIERLSSYKASSGRSYASDYATIKSWLERDKPRSKAPNYRVDPGDCL